ncbi:MAG: type I-C CRISPR-associated protein Cas8c/Csd1 [Oscillospiraceae bacterium]|nr:type I-C CRISPR-associated protein Cas8c/Csd1 [Oscillospiraceae bacterium]
MILQSLVSHYEELERRGEISPPGWGPERVSYALNLSTEGELLGVLTLLREEARGKKTVKVPKVMRVPERVVKAAGIKSNFLCDNTTYLLGVDNKGKGARALDAFAACKALHLQLLADVQTTAASAVKGFFAQWNPEAAAQHPALSDVLDDMMGSNLVFCIDGGAYAHEDPAVKAAWMAAWTNEEDSPIIRCLVTGERAPLALLHGKIKGVPGAQSAGANLISYNAPAFTFYGKRCASIGRYAAFAHVTALNHLISTRDYRQQLGDTLVLFWAERADPMPPQLFSLYTGLGPPDENGALTAIMVRLLQGQYVEEVDLTAKFYVLGLAPNAARISVRFFLQDSFGAFLDNLAAHYERLEIVRPSYDTRVYLTLPALMYETVNPNSRDKASSPLLSGAALRAILSGGDYPEGLFQAVMLRIRAEHEVTRGRAAIIKAYLRKNRGHKKEELTVALNPELRDRAYVLGRLFAVLERAQSEANPGINTTIKDKYLNTACANPAVVFPQLLRLAGHHTAKSDYGVHRNREIGELLQLIDAEDGEAFPAQHTLAQQGMFFLGYYHQTQARYQKKEEKENGSN